MKKQLQKFNRKTGGSLIVIAVGLLALLLALGLLIFKGQNYLLRRAHLKSATEAASLSCSTDLSRIILKDSKWGFVSLSDCPACGDATLAGDGKAVPIVSLNSALATSRLELLTARNIDNAYLLQEAQEDYNATIQSCHNFQDHLGEAIESTSNREFIDWNGKKVDAYGNALEILKDNLPDLRTGACKLDKFYIKLGWLEEGSETLTLNCERKSGDDGDTYIGFNNYPVDTCDFYFAGVSNQSRLVSSGGFREPDDKRICSAVQIIASLKYPDYVIEVSSTSIPQATLNKSASGSLAIHFPQGELAEIKNLKSLLEQNSFNQIKPQRTFAVYGDYPGDCGSILRTKNDAIPWNLSRSVARATLDWLRTNHGKARFLPVMNSMQSPFANYTGSRLNSVLIYDFTNAGECLISCYENGGFGKHTVSESQSLDLAYGIMPTRKGNLGISIRNQVIDNDITEGGKHAGQPLTSEMPLNYENPSGQDKPDPQIDPGRCRLSYLKGGLAVGMELFVH